MLESMIVRNVNHALVKGHDMLVKHGVVRETRAGTVLKWPYPVVTAYQRPTERVVFSRKRDANPFFHLFESLWMLAGRNDATWLDTFVKLFSLRFAESDGHQHGAYGHRWRRHFDLEGGGEAELPDQLTKVCELLRANPEDRQVVLTMWDPVADLGGIVNDKPCNTHIYLSGEDGKLNMTVLCRSNDLIWGACGANAVHMSVMMEYVAAASGLDVGTYYQFSNNYHAYVGPLDKLGAPELDDRYADGEVVPLPMVTDPHCFLFEVERWVENPQQMHVFVNTWLTEVATPMAHAHAYHRERRYDEAYDAVNRIMATDWQLAAREWLMRREASYEALHNNH